MLPDYRNIMMARFGIQKPMQPMAPNMQMGMPQQMPQMGAPQMQPWFQPEGRVPRPMGLGSMTDTMQPEGRVPRPMDLGSLGYDGPEIEGRSPRLHSMSKIPGSRY